MPVHPSHIPLAPMYPPDFDIPTPAPQPPSMSWALESATAPWTDVPFYYILLVIGFVPCPPCLFAREKVPSVIVSYIVRGVAIAT
eukprot:scaffold4698_cov115-Isochrysis_galbana.AAC.8